MQRLLTASKRLPFRSRKKAVSDYKSEYQSNVTFFDLPAEIRNQIYELAAIDTAVVLPSSKSAKGVSPPGLLLANKAVWQEYRTILLANAVVSADVEGYDFRNFTRVVSGLSRNDLLALGTNNRLEIRLRLGMNPITNLQDPQPLRLYFAWLHQYQPSSNGELGKRLDWKYEIIPQGREVAHKLIWPDNEILHLRKRHLNILNEAHRALDGICRNERYVMMQAWMKWCVEYNENRPYCRMPIT